MRLGVVIPVGPSLGLGQAIGTVATEVEAAGLDVALLRGDPHGLADALTAAAFLSGSTAGLRLIACVPIGGHPLHIAEQAAVADNALGGRLVVALEDEGGEPESLSETVDVLLTATGPRPFEHRGPRWSIPGHIEGNNSERRIGVTPKPAQLELPVWVSGEAAAGVAADFGLSYLARSTDGAEKAGEAWTEIERSLGRATRRLRRPAIRRLDCAPDGDFDDGRLIERLIGESDRWGLDVAILQLPAAVDAAARVRAVARLGSRVRPHLLMDEIPERVREYWRQELPARGLD